MTGNGWKRQDFEFLSGGGVHQSSQRAGDQKPPTPVACRLCGEVFLDNWVLIDHVGVHLGLAEASSRMRSETNRLLYSRDPPVLNPNPLPRYYVSLVPNRPGLQAQQGGYLVHTTRRDKNPSVGRINLIGAHPSAKTQRGVRPSERGNSRRFRSIAVPSLLHPQAQQLAPKDPPSDPTKPFLNQLEWRLASEMKRGNGKKDVVIDESSPATLDLTLKL